MRRIYKCHNNFGGDRSPGTIRKDWRKTSNMFPGKLKMHQLQKNTLLGSTSPILRKTLLYQIDLCFILIGWPYKIMDVPIYVVLLMVV